MLNSMDQYGQYWIHKIVRVLEKAKEQNTTKY